MLSIFEYDEELHFKTLREEGYESGYAEGHESGFSEGHEAGLEQGMEQGASHLADLLQKLMDTGRSEDINRAISDPEYRKQLYLENI